MNTDLHQRSGHGDNEDAEIQLSEEDVYGADIGTNGHVKAEPKVLIDPGPFRYNRRVCVVALPIFLLMLSMVGESLVLLICFGVAVLLCIDSKGQQQRSMVVFMSLFVPSHILIIYSFFPLIWVTVLNLILLALVNGFILLTGGWIVLQFKIFRMNESDICEFLESMLFSAYPFLSVCLLCWAASTVVPLQYVPFLLALIGFVFLQLFMTPTTSSFRKIEKDEENYNILNISTLSIMSVIYLTLPPFVQIFAHVVKSRRIFHITFITEFMFLLMTQMFLWTLMSIRPIVEFLGIDHSLIVKIRWLCGAAITVLSYPVLMHLGMSSHFLPWLPGAIGIYSVFGATLSYKKNKRISDAVFAVAVLFSILWGLLLPWKIAYKFIYGLPLPIMFVVMLTNAVLCLLIGYSGSHGKQEIFSGLVCLQSFVFVFCESFLYDAGLYKWQLFLITCIIAAYTFQRLHLSKKLPLRLSCFCMSVYITKATAVLVEQFVFHPNRIPVHSYLTIFFWVFMMIRIFVTDFDPNVSSFPVQLGLLCISVLLNANPLVFVLSSYIFMSDSSGSDVTGLCFIVSGVLIIMAQSIHLPENNQYRYCGVLAIFLGLIFIVLRPDMSLSLYGVFQWCEVLSTICLLVVIGTDFITSFLQIIACSVVLGLCPGFRAAIMLYPEENTPVPGVLLFMVASCIITCIILCFIKAHHLRHTFEKRFRNLTISLAIVSIAVLFSDMATKDDHQDIYTLPALRLITFSSLVICICLKLLALRQTVEILPLSETREKDEKPYLPTIGNVATFISFFLICLVAPTSSFFHDVWCCGASIVLVCLQKDLRIFSNLGVHNQTTPTKMTAIFILFAASIYRSDIWTYASGWMFARCFSEIFLILCSIPNFYILSGLLYDNVLYLSETVAVFTLPLNFLLLLYSSSYTGWVYAVSSMAASLWMMTSKFALQPYHDEND